MQMMKRVVAAVRLLGALLIMASPAFSQVETTVQTPILTVESERLFADSAFGQRLTLQVEAEQSVLLAENRRIEAELTAEEKRLTELRAEMSPEDFRAVADAFDKRVQKVRQEQDTKGRAIAEMQDRQRSLFIQAARPVLVELMREGGADVILERRAILISTDAIDITDRAIELLNLSIGDGGALARE